MASTWNRMSSVSRTPTRALNDRQLAHRQRMLDHLRRYNG
jgi:hypothetical protein